MQPSNFITPGLFKTVNGDSSQPIHGGHRIIINMCSNSGDWEDNNTNKRWEKVKTEYKQWFRSQNKFIMGEMQVINVQSDTTVVNMLVLNKNEFDNDALFKCMDKVGELAKDFVSNVHINKGSNWAPIESMLVDRIIKRGINVTIYE